MGLIGYNFLPKQSGNNTTTDLNIEVVLDADDTYILKSDIMNISTLMSEA